jgi:chromosome segregation ATPase
LSFSGLKSNVLNQTCTEQSQKNKLPQYTDFLKKRDQAQKTLNIASGEMAVLNKRISDNNSIIVEKQAQIAEKNTKINELTAYIDKYCKNPRDRNIAQICQTKKQQKRDLGQDVQIIKNSIATLQNTINQLAQNIKNNQRIITEQINLISRYTLFINQYEACEQQLKIKPLLTSPSMSGEAMIS